MQMKSTKDIRRPIKPIAEDTLTRDGSVYAIIAEEDIGKFWGAVRRNGLDPVASRRTGDTLVARFEGEESGGLGDLFG
jgi:hypothetical protein